MSPRFSLSGEIAFGRSAAAQEVKPVLSCWFEVAGMVRVVEQVPKGPLEREVPRLLQQEA